MPRSWAKSRSKSCQLKVRRLLVCQNDSCCRLFVSWLAIYLVVANGMCLLQLVTTAASILFVSLFLSHCSADCKVFEYQLVFGLLVNVFGCSLCVCLYLVSFVCLYHNSCSAWYCYTVFVLLVDVCAGPQIVRCLNINFCLYLYL